MASSTHPARGPGLRAADDGTSKLAAVEYVASGAERPALFGVPFDETNICRRRPTPSVLGAPRVDLEAEPDTNAGIFAPWNPRVTCN